MPVGPTLANTACTLIGSMNARRRLEASMRIDAAGTQPVFGGLCPQLKRIAGLVINQPLKERQVLAPYFYLRSPCVKYTVFLSPTWPCEPVGRIQIVQKKSWATRDNKSRVACSLGTLLLKKFQIASSEVELLTQSDLWRW
jgi:hypothetical protein